MVSGMLKRAIVRSARSDSVVVVFDGLGVGLGDGAWSIAMGEAESWLSWVFSFVRVVVMERLVGFGSAMLTDKIRALNFVSLRIKDASASS